MSTPGFGGYGGGGAWGGTVETQSAKAHQVVVFSGYKVNPASPGSRLEDWSFRLKTQLDLDATLASLEARATACRSAYMSWINPSMANDTKLERVTVAQVDDAGHWGTTADGAYVKGENSEVGTGTGSAPAVMPLQTSLVVSLVTTRAGASGKGRFYLPWPSVYSIDGDRLLSVANQATLAGAAAGFLGDLKTAGAVPRVFSYKGFSTAVTAVRVGRRPDILRSRAENAPESWVTEPLP